MTLALDWEMANVFPETEAALFTIMPAGIDSNDIYSALGRGIPCLMPTEISPMDIWRDCEPPVAYIGSETWNLSLPADLSFTSKLPAVP